MEGAPVSFSTIKLATFS